MRTWSGRPQSWLAILTVVEDGRPEIAQRDMASHDDFTPAAGGGRSSTQPGAYLAVLAESVDLTDVAAIFVSMFFSPVGMFCLALLGGLSLWLAGRGVPSYLAAAPIPVFPFAVTWVVAEAAGDTERLIALSTGAAFLLVFVAAVSGELWAASRTAKG